MAGLFNKNAQAQQRSQNEILASRYFSARHNILLIVVFTVINIFLLITNAGSYFLFSAFIPYMLVDYGMYFCGLYPAEVYGEYYLGAEFFGISFMIICTIIAVVVVLFYLVSWLLTKKPRVGWMIFALVFFAVDTVVMLLMISDFSNFILDLLFHAWAIFSLTWGVISYFKLKKLQEEPEQNLAPEEINEPAHEVVE